MLKYMSCFMKDSKSKVINRINAFCNDYRRIPINPKRHSVYWNLPRFVYYKEAYSYLIESHLNLVNSVHILFENIIQLGN